MNGVERLLDVLNRNLAWRKKELTSLHLLSQLESEPTAGYLRRAGVALLYAHWEGFVSDTGREYLRCLSASELPTAKLRDVFVAESMRGSIRQAGSSDSTVDHADLVARMRASLLNSAHRTRVKWKGVVRTGANLNVERLKTLIASLGLDYAPYRLKEVTVIARIVRERNLIAHGVGKPVDASLYDHLHGGVLLLMDALRDQTVEAAATDAHLLSSVVPDGWHL